MARSRRLPPISRRRRQIRPRTDPDEYPFHRRYLILFAWALVATLLGVAATIGYQKWQGPQQVLVMNPDTTRRLVVIGDTTGQEYLATVLRELQKLQSAQPAPAAAPIEDSVAALRPAGTSSGRARHPNPLRLPGFIFPPMVKGASVKEFSLWGSGTCPARAVSGGSNLQLLADLRLPADTARLTPLHVNILKPQDATSVVLVSEIWYELLPRNYVVVPAPSEPGTYALEYGVYPRAELNSEFPPYYRRSCQFTVH